MPEYLAPGVYVEEHSFRAKSIEGVSTSTTAFVGMTRKGPVYDPDLAGDNQIPEMLTSFADFQRIYGGLEGLPAGPNYLAHAVRAYFDNGGARLFVTRAFLAAGDDDDGRAVSAPVIDNAAAAERVRFVARTPGSAGNGRLEVRQIVAPATLTSINAAPTGSFLRVGTTGAARRAILLGGTGPFALPDGGVLRIRLGEDTTVDLTVRGAPAEAIAAEALDENTDLDETNNTLRVRLDGREQTIVFPTEAMSRERVVEAINTALRGRGRARLTEGAEEGGANRLAIAGARGGRRASARIFANEALGFSADATASGANVEANNVNDLGAVTADELNALLVAQDVDARATVDPATRRLALSTTATGRAARIQVLAEEVANSIHAALGFTPATPATGRDGVTPTSFTKRGANWADAGNVPLALDDWRETGAPEAGAELITLSIAALDDTDDTVVQYDDVGLDPAHPSWIGHVLAPNPARRSDALENPYAIEIGDGVSADELYRGLFESAVGDERYITLSGGDDGVEPNAAAFATALEVLEKMDDVSIVAAPGSSALADAQGIMLALISHAERRRAYRIAVLDTPAGLLPGEARAVRSQIDSKYAALYYPWVVVSNPLSRPGAADIPREIALPPSGFVCGIYARNDVERGVHKAPANEVVRGALRFETDINFAQQEALNPLGVNCLRFFPGRGYRVWGARLSSSDPEWKYVNVRRYFNYLERSIDQGTQWAVFEPNGERLWANVRETVSSFLYNEWVSGALLGGTPKEAFFVRCDRSTMTQNDLDNGRLICLVGVAVLKPAEFVIFRIGQKTADARS